MNDAARNDDTARNDNVTGNDVSTLRLYLLRFLYALICVGMGSIIWPLMFHHGPWSVMHSVAASMLAALTLLCALGVRYPLKMLPLMLFEFAWKTIWMVGIALPLWLAHKLDAETMETVIACGMGVVLCPLVIPWRYVWFHYVLRPGDRWGARPKHCAEWNLRLR